MVQRPLYTPSLITAFCHVLLIIAVGFIVKPAFAQTNVSVEITGVNQILENNVRLFLSIEQQKDHPLMSAGRLRRLHKKAIDEIKAALQPYGYYRPQIDSALKKLESGEWQASYAIDPGAAIPIAEFNFLISREISEDPAFVELLKEESVRSAAVFNHLNYEEFKSDLARLAAERGYFDAGFIDHRVEIDLNNYVARIYLNFDGGTRYRFGETVLHQDALEQDFIQRFVPFTRGEPYTLEKLVELQQVLNDTEYFQTAEVTTGKLLSDSHEVPVEITLIPRKKNRYEFGLGYGTDTGARVKLGWQVPRVNPAGHRFNSNVEFSEIGHRLQANYRVPIFNPRTDQIIYSATQEVEEFEDTESRLNAVGVSLVHNRGDWRETLALNYQQEDFESGDDSGDSTLLIPGIGWSRIWGKGFINVVDGLRFTVNLRGASESLVSDTDFSQLKTQLKFISSINPRNRIIARGQIGATSVSNFEQLPSSIRFFSGGAQSVRGFRYQSLGPVDDNGDVVGGAYLVLGSIEFEHYFNDRWGAALFYDTGNAIDDLEDSLETGVGFGLRWKSPVGPVRIDLASAISRDDKPWRLHINIGPDL